MAEYNFTTIWKLNSPLQKVWDALNDPTIWPMWWKGAEEVTDIEPGDASGLGGIKHFTWKSRLPYTLSFNSIVTVIEPMKRVEGIVFGELNGKGVWTFSADNNYTIVRYEWMVKTTKWWMNLLAPVARPAFEWNHDVIMNWGGKGLAKRLGCKLVE